MIISEYKPINFTYYNPCTSLFKASKSDRERITVYLCNNSENCDAYKRGKCIMLNGFGHRCPYGKIERREGYTKAARKCGELVNTMRAKYSDVEYALKSLSFVCNIADYVFLNLPYLDNYQNPFRPKDFFACGDDVIQRDNFTPELVVELIKYKPYALFGGEIKSYQNEHIPKFCSQLKRHMPDMYKKVRDIYPAIEERIENIDYTDKRAKVMTLLPGKVKLSTNILEWDGKVIRGKGNQIIFWRLKDEDLIIVPTKDTVVTIYDNGTVTDETELIDE